MYDMFKITVGCALFINQSSRVRSWKCSIDFKAFNSLAELTLIRCLFGTSNHCNFGMIYFKMLSVIFIIIEKNHMNLNDCSN